jgi:hypothetical protein
MEKMSLLSTLQPVMFQAVKSIGDRLFPEAQNRSEDEGAKSTTQCGSDSDEDAHVGSAREL